MRRQLGELADRLSRQVDLVFPDAPHPCGTDSVKRIYKEWRALLPAPPYCRWWNAVDEGRVYEGWEETRDRLGALMEERQPVGLIGFSQGAIVATALVALSQAGELPPLKFAILIAGGAPRSDILRPYLQKPLDLPSLHVWGDADEVMQEAAPRLAKHYSVEGRVVHIWPGRHAVPDEGKAADAIVDFVRLHA